MNEGIIARGRGRPFKDNRELPLPFKLGKRWVCVTACNHPRVGSQSSAGWAHASCNWRKVLGSRYLRMGSVAFATGSQS